MQREDEKNSKTPGTPKDSGAPKAAEPSETPRELTDDEIAAVAGGRTAGRPLNPQLLPP